MRCPVSRGDGLKSIDGPPCLGSCEVHQAALGYTFRFGPASGHSVQTAIERQNRLDVVPTYGSKGLILAKAV